MRWVFARAAAAALLAAASGQSAAAQLWSDARTATVEYAGDGLTHINTSPDVTQTVMFAQHERIRSVVLSDPDAYLVSVSGPGNSLTLRANGPSAIAIMNVQTGERSYQLELVPDISGVVPQVIRFSQGPAGMLMPPGMAPRQSPDGASWRISGDRAIRPASIRDDGKKTYIAWSEDQPLPAVFVDAEGRNEESVDGRMRAGVFTIDSVYPRLVFRIDDRVARAERRAAKKTKGALARE